MVEIALVQLPNRVLGSPTMFFPLGILYLGAVLEHSGYKVTIVDLSNNEADINLIPRASFIGFTATTGEIEDARMLSHKVKARDPKCLTLIGGAHASLMPENVKRDFDVVVIGEGEKAVVRICNEQITGTLSELRIEDLDAIPFPAWHLVAPQRLFSELLWFGEKYGTGPRAASIITSRGCPMACHFCANILRSPAVYRSPENVAAEIKELRDHYGIYHFRDESDNLTLNKNWLFKVCDALRPLGCHFKGHTRSDLVDKEIVEALKSCGFEELGLGIETCDDTVLELANKRETSEDHYRAARIIKAVGLRLRCYFMVGLPGETNETIGLNKRFIREIRPKWTLSRFTPYPGCAMWQDPKKFGLINTGHDFSNFWNFSEHPNHELVNASKEELDRRYKEFYQWLRQL